MADDILSRYYGDNSDPLRLAPSTPSRHPMLDDRGLPDIDWAARRRAAMDSQSPGDRWFDDHDRNMRNFMHEATGLVPGLHAGQRAYNHWVDPEHPITQQNRSVPWAIANGVQSAGELLLPYLGGMAGRYLTGRAPYADLPASRIPMPEEVYTTGVLGKPVDSDVIPAVAGWWGMGAPRSATKFPNPERITEYDPHVPGAIRPRPVRDPASELAPPERPLSGLKVHGEPVDTYHGTSAPFDRFDKDKSRHFGIHSGTPRAANTFTDYAPEGTGRVLPMRLGPQDRPFTSLEVRDMGTWEPLEMARELERRGVRFSEEEFDKLVGVLSKNYLTAHQKKEAYPLIENALNRHGVDALRYQNMAEDRGSTSWITWNPETLYSRTTGSQLYGVPAAGVGAAGLMLDKAYGPDQKNGR